MKVLILSPHCDDVPLSLGGSLINRYLGRNIEVIIVFSRSAYTVKNKGNANITVTTRIRIDEEKIAAEKLGYKVTFWNFDEASVRPGFNLIEDICNPSRDPKDDPIWVKISERVEQLLQDFSGVILAPLGYGNHIDHRIVNQAVIKYCDNNYDVIDIYPAFYEDLPYFSKRDVNNLIQLKKYLPNRLNFFQYYFKVYDLDKKLDVLHTYASQMDKDFYQGITDHWIANKGEYIWATNNTIAKLNSLK